MLIIMIDPFYLPWLHELIQDPVANITKELVYFTCYFTFHAYEYVRCQGTVKYGICIKGETNFYGNFQKIIEVEFAGLVQINASSSNVKTKVVVISY